MIYVWFGDRTGDTVTDPNFMSEKLQNAYAYNLYMHLPRYYFRIYLYVGIYTVSLNAHKTQKCRIEVCGLG